MVARNSRESAEIPRVGGGTGARAAWVARQAFGDQRQPVFDSHTRLDRARLECVELRDTPRRIRLAILEPRLGAAHRRARLGCMRLEGAEQHAMLKRLRLENGDRRDARASTAEDLGCTSDALERPGSREDDDRLLRLRRSRGEKEIDHHPLAAVRRGERDLLARSERCRLLLFDLRVERRLFHR